MNSFKYSRLPTSEVANEFRALDGPSYFTYGPSGVDNAKYKSAFTYSTLNVESPHEDVPELPAPSVLCRVCSSLVTALCYIAFVLTLPVSAWWTVKSVQHYERIVLFRLGRLSAALGPGYVVVFPCIDRWVRVDLRMKAFSVPPQKVITADSATLEIGADVYFRVKDAIPSVTNVQDLNHSTRIICQTLLQKHIGKQTLSDIEMDRASIANTLQIDVNQMTQTWGVEVSRVELSSLKIHSQPNPLFERGGPTNNPLSVLGPVLFPPGNSNAPVEQLQNFYLFGGHSSDTSSSDASGGKQASRGAADMITNMRQHLTRSLVNEFGCVYKFVITDETGATNVYHLDLKNGEGRADFGDPPDGDVDVTLTLTMAVLREMLAGRLTAFNAYMTGQLAISGDLKTAMKLGQLFETMKKS